MWQGDELIIKALVLLGTSAVFLALVARVAALSMGQG